MPDSQKLMGKPGEMGESNKEGKISKRKFTPPILHEYGEVVKICKQTKTEPGSTDYYLNS